MSVIPVIEHLRPRVSRGDLQNAEDIAERFRSECQELADDQDLMPYACQSLNDGPTLHLDDLSTIPLLEGWRNLNFQQDRARIRAGDGDFVATSAAPAEGYEEYCQHRLGLGTVRWVVPESPGNATELAAMCWQDEGVRHELIEAVRADRIRYLHPHLGSKPVWELARLISEEAARNVAVIGPPPGLTSCVNNKLLFAELSRRLFGPASVPWSTYAASLAKAAEIVHRLASRYQAVSIKLPDSVGGGGNVLIDSATLAGATLSQVYDQLHDEFFHSTWEGKSKLLIGCWETEVRTAPSAQLWIPPEQDGDPVFEGLFTQQLSSRRGGFTGAQPAELSDDLEQQIVSRCWVLGRIFQRWGYIGRCSFDMLIVGPPHQDPQLKLLECNGRWGATSLPMTLMNRLFGDWRLQPFAVQDIQVDGLDRSTFRALLAALTDQLYDSRTGNGRMILMNPGRMSARSAITVVAMADSWKSAVNSVRNEVPQLLEEAIRDL